MGCFRHVDNMRTFSLSDLCLSPCIFCCILLPVRDFYRQRSAGLAAEESDGVEEVHTRLPDLLLLQR
jgi:hypothetical protein